MENVHDINEAKIETFKVEAGALIEVPVYDSHKRGKNWLAVINIDPRGPGGLGRRFIEKARGKYYYMIDELKVGDAIEFGADYYAASGNKYPERWYGVIKTITPEAIEIIAAKTGTQAIKMQEEK